MFELKRYQLTTIEALAEYLRMARETGASEAYVSYMQKQGIDGVQYNTYDLGNIPYICLRLPTGGGKTVLASYGIREAAFNYMNKINPLVLWLVPTITIAEQTLGCLQKAQHPYRQAIDEYFGGRVSVFPIADVVNIRPQDLDNRVCIVIGTMASLRVQDRTGRRIYDHNENYQEHFERAQYASEGMDKIEGGTDAGKIKYSFVNLCHVHKPLVILDEAHNARTNLSFETLKRLNPSCVIELTATPNISSVNGSNVLHSVSALELKHEEMIKLPIVLTEHRSWQEAVSEAILSRKHLATFTENEDNYVRPIVLFQAENKDKEVTVEVLKDYLLNNESIAENTIATVTGNIKELQDIDLFSRDCVVEYIITVEALKEGWDCSFAYVFCSVANVKSNTAVEQLLGRVLRMPYAKKRKSDALNMAYAHVTSPSFAEAAKDLKDSLINKMGFEKLEADAYVKAQGQIESPTQMDLFNKHELKPIAVEFFETHTLTECTLNKLKITETNGAVELQLVDYVDDAELEQIVAAVPRAAHTEVRQHFSKERIALSLNTGFIEKAVHGFKVPRMVFVDNNETIDFLDEDSFLEAGEWSLLDYSHELPYFKVAKTGNKFEIDVSETNKVIWSGEEYIYQEQAIAFSLPNLDVLDLINWLDKEIHRPDIPQFENFMFIHNAIGYLQKNKELSLEMLFMAKFQLAIALKELIKANLAKAKVKGYHKLVIEQQDMLQVNSNYSFSFPLELDAYPVGNRYYNDSYQFKKHLYEIIGFMNGEEIECAKLIDKHPMVKTWIRNLERKPATSFWLPTNTDKFYPDFIAELSDGRILVVEYKGEMLSACKDTDEKTFIGNLWARLSGGKGLFLMGLKLDANGLDLRQQITEIV